MTYKLSFLNKAFKRDSFVEEVDELDLLKRFASFTTKLAKEFDDGNDWMLTIEPIRKNQA